MNPVQSGGPWIPGPCFVLTPITGNKTPKVVSVGCVDLWNHNGVLSEFGKIRETGKMCHVMSIDE